MRVLMTGATGLIGKEIGKRLAEKGVHLVVVSRNPHRAKLELPFPAEVFEWKHFSEKFPDEALENINGIIHLAGESIAQGRWSDKKKELIRESRILGTKRLVEAINRRSGTLPEVFILGSAIGIYGDCGNDVVDESSSPGQGFLANVVRDWEAETVPLERLGIRIAKVRTGVVFSRREGAFAKIAPIFMRGLGGHLGDGQQWMSWIHINDIARIFIFSLENSLAKGSINAAAPEPVRNERFTVTLARALGRSVFLPVPKAALKLGLGEASSVILDSQRVLPVHLQELGFKFDFGEIKTAIDDLCEPLRAGQHEFVSEQWIPRSPGEIFPYFCSETNLENLTPPFLKFKVLGKSTQKIEVGTLIDYRMSLHGLPVRWKTQIDTWKNGESFSDRQLHGPYQKWHHLHEFIPLAGGTLMRDRVLYKLPLGIIGEAIGGGRVLTEVTRIFAYRRQIIGERFGVVQ